MRGVKQEHLLCKALRHAWEPSAPIYNSRGGGQHLFLVCTRCGTERTDDLDPVGDLWGRQYGYSETYRQFLDGDGKLMSLGEARKEIQRRMAAEAKKLR
jgi:hypothetical protein